MVADDLWNGGRASGWGFSGACTDSAPNDRRYKDAGQLLTIYYVYQRSLTWWFQRCQ